MSNWRATNIWATKDAGPFVVRFSRTGIARKGEPPIVTKLVEYPDAELAWLAWEQDRISPTTED